MIPSGAPSGTGRGEFPPRRRRGQQGRSTVRGRGSGLAPTTPRTGPTPKRPRPPPLRNEPKCKLAPRPSALTRFPPPRGARRAAGAATKRTQVQESAPFVRLRVPPRRPAWPAPGGPRINKIERAGRDGHRFRPAEVRPRPTPPDL